MQSYSDLHADAGLELHRSIRIHGPRSEACRLLEDVTVWPILLARLEKLDDSSATSHQVASVGSVTLEWTAALSDASPCEVAVHLTDGPDGPRTLLTAEMHFRSVIHSSDALASHDVVDDLMQLREHFLPDVIRG